MTARECRADLEYARARKQTLEETVTDLEERTSIQLQRVEDCKRGVEIVTLVTISVQQKAVQFIEDVVTLCLSTVYGDDYGFSLEYEVKRNQAQAVPNIVTNGEKIDPRNGVGGGVVDVASLGLRLALWVLQGSTHTPVFILDEPLKFVSVDLTDRVVLMLTQVCEVFGIQIIMVSHDDGLIGGADKVVCVSKVDGVSEVKVVY